jgi:DNA-binding HxlR family transcriptional regulator
MASKTTARATRKAPLPGRPVRGSSSGRPIMAALDLLGRRWVLRIVWELREGPMTFRALRAAASDVSPSVLNQRLVELREARIVTSSADGYALTGEGAALLEALGPLLTWSKRWAAAR